MSTTLLDHANATGNLVRQGIVRNIIETSPGLMQAMPFVNAPQLRYEFSKEGDLPTTGFRALNEQYASGSARFERNAIHLKPMGGELAIDRKMAKSPTFDAMEFAARGLMMLSRSASMNFKKYLINGDVSLDVKEFDGVKKIVSELGASQTVTFGTNGVTIASQSANVLVSKMEELINAAITVPSVLLTNRTILAQMHALATTAAQNNAFASQFTLSTQEFNGIRYRVGQYSGIPILAVDTDAAGNEIMPFTETVGNASLSSSIYALCLGDGFFTAVQDDAPEVLEEQDGTSRRIIVDWAVAAACEHPKAIAKLEGIRAS